MALPYDPTETPAPPGVKPKPAPKDEPDFIPAQTPKDFPLTDAEAKQRSILQLNQRASYLPQHFVDDAPWTAGWLITSPLPHDVIQKIGHGLARGWPWLKSQNGPDGAYLGARASALFEPDAARRADLLDEINQRVDPENPRPVLRPVAKETGGGGTITPMHEGGGTRTVYVDAPTNSPLHKLVAEAVQNWNNATGHNVLDIVPKKGEADVVFHAGDEERIPKGWAGAFYPGAVADDYVKKDFYNVSHAGPFTHELGWALGLDVSQFPGVDGLEIAKAGSEHLKLSRNSVARLTGGGGSIAPSGMTQPDPKRILLIGLSSGIETERIRRAIIAQQFPYFASREDGLKAFQDSMRVAQEATYGSGVTREDWNSFHANPTTPEEHTIIQAAGKLALHEKFTWHDLVKTFVETVKDPEIRSGLIAYGLMGPKGMLAVNLAGNLLGLEKTEAFKATAGYGAVGAGAYAAQKIAGPVVAGGLDLVGAKSAASAVKKFSAGDVTSELNTVFGRASDVVFGAPLGGITEAVKAAEGKPAGLSDWWHKYAWNSNPGSGAGLAVADAAGLKPGSAAYDAVSSTTDLVAGLLAVSAVGETARAIKGARTEIAPDLSKISSTNAVSDMLNADRMKGLPEVQTESIAGGREHLINDPATNEPVGSLFIDNNGARITVDPEWRRRGVGTKLALQAMKDEGLTPDSLRSMLAQTGTPSDVSDFMDTLTRQYNDAQTTSVKNVRQDYRQELRKQSGYLGRAIIELLKVSKTPDEFITGRGAQRYFRQMFQVAQLNPDSAADSLVRVAGGNLTASEARVLSTAASPEEMARAWAAMKEGRSDPEMINRLQSQVQDLQNQVMDQLDLQRNQPNNAKKINAWFKKEHGTFSSVSLDDAIKSAPEDVRKAYQDNKRILDMSQTSKLNADLVQLRSILDNPVPNNISFSFPKPSMVKRLALALSMSPKWKALSDRVSTIQVLSGMQAKLIHFSNAFTQLHENRFLDQTGWNARPDALDKNRDYAEYLMKKGGVPLAIRKRIISAFVNATNHEEEVQARMALGNAIADSPIIAADLKPRIARVFALNTDTSNRAEYPNKFQDTNPNSPTFGTELTHHQSIWQQKGPDGKFRATPGISAEFARGTPGIDINLLTDATSFMRTRDRALHKKFGGTTSGDLKSLHTLGYRALKAVPEAITNVLKPMDLAVRVPAIIERAGIEHRLRMYMAGESGGAGLVSTARSLFGKGELADAAKFFGKADPRELGGILTTLATDQGDAHWLPMTFKGHELVDEYADGIGQRLQMFNSSPEVRRLVDLKGDTSKWVKWLKTDPEGQSIRKAFNYIGDEDLAKWGKNIWESVRYYTNDHPGLMKAISTGEWGESRLSRNDVGETPAEEIERINSELDAMGPAINAAYAENDLSKINALTQARRELGLRKRDLKKTVDALADREDPIVDLRDLPAFTKKLQDAFNNNEYEPPEQINAEARDNFKSRRKAGMSLSRNFADSVYGSAWFRGVGKADQAITRQPYYLAHAKEYYAKLRALGWDQDHAKAMATVKAARDTSDLFYNLSARSDADRFLRNVFWYAPLAENAAKTWLVEIPSRYYWPVGAAITYERFHLVTQFLKQSGIMKDVPDPNDPKKKIPYIGGPIGDWLSKHAGRGAAAIIDPLVLSINPKQLSVITGGKGLGPISFPQLNPAYGDILGHLGRDHWHALKVLSDNLSIPGGDPSGGIVSDIIWAQEAATGKPSKYTGLLEPYAGYLASQAWTNARRAAWVRLNEEGVRPPQFINPDGTHNSKYVALDENGNFKNWKTTNVNGRSVSVWQQDSLAYQKQVDDEAKGIFRVFALIHLAGATVTPAPLHISDKYGDDEKAMWQEIGKEPPKDSPQHQGWVERRSTYIEQFKNGHPYGAPYLVGTTAPGQFPRTLPGQDPSTMSFYDKIFSGQVEARTPEEWMTLVMGWNSWEFLRQSRESAIAKALGKKSYADVTAADLLTNWYQYGYQVSKSQLDWKAYLDGNPDFAKEWKALGYGIPGFELNQLVDMRNALRVYIEPRLAVDGIRPQSLRDVEREVGKDIAALIATEDSGAPGTTKGLGAALQWYKDNVLNPYFAEVDPLRQQAESIKQTGGDPSSLYEQIREKNNEWENKSNVYNGQKLPGPAEFLFGLNTPQEQAETKLKWQTRPITWLTNYQIKTAGFDVPQNWSAFATWQTGFESYVNDFVKRNNISTSGNYYQNSLLPWMNQQSEQKAAEFGSQVQNLWHLSQAAPYKRLEEANPWLKSDPVWQQIIGAVSYVESAAAQSGKSLKGDSVWNTPLKDWVFGPIQSFIAGDQRLSNLFEDLGVATAPSSGPNREGNTLFDTIFFDNWSPYGYQPRYERKTA